MQNFINGFNLRKTILSSPEGGFVERNKNKVDHYYKNIYVRYSPPAVIAGARLHAAIMPLSAIADVGRSLINGSKADFGGYLLNLAMAIKMVFLTIITWPLALAKPSLIYGNSLKSEEELKQVIANYIDENFESNPSACLQTLFSDAKVDPRLVRPFIDKLLRLNDDVFEKREKALNKIVDKIPKQRIGNRLKDLLSTRIGLERDNVKFIELLESVEKIDPRQNGFTFDKVDQLRPEGVNTVQWRKAKNLINKYLSEKYPFYINAKNKTDFQNGKKIGFSLKKAYSIAKILGLNPNDQKVRDQIAAKFLTLIEGKNNQKRLVSELLKIANNPTEKTKQILTSFIEKEVNANHALQNRNAKFVKQIITDLRLNPNTDKEIISQIVDEGSNLDINDEEYAQDRRQLMDRLKYFDFYRLHAHNRRESIEFMTQILVDLVFKRAPDSCMNADNIKLLSAALEIRSPFVKEAVWDLIKKSDVSQIDKKENAYETLLVYFAKMASASTFQKYADLGKGLDFETQKAYLTLLYKLNKSEFSTEQKDLLIQRLKESENLTTDINYISTLVSISNKNEIDTFLQSGKPLNDPSIFKPYFEKIIPNITAEQCKKLVEIPGSKSILLYGKRLEELPHGVRVRMQEKYKDALLAVINDQFSEFRHNTPHLNALDKAVVDKWKVNHSYKIHELVPKAAKYANYTISETENLIDLLTLGTSLNTCMHLDGRLSRVKCLQGFLIDGKYHTIAVHGDKGEVIAECQIVLLWDESNKVPVILLENPNIVGNSLEIKKAMIEFAKGKAKEMGLTLLDARMIGISSYKGKVVSRTSNAIFEFVDHKLSVITGPWSVSNPRVIPT
jgi:hypothetical protein